MFPHMSAATMKASLEATASRFRIKKVDERRRPIVKNANGCTNVALTFATWGGLRYKELRRKSETCDLSETSFKGECTPGKSAGASIQV